jgi:uncharacterized protein
MGSLHMKESEPDCRPAVVVSTGANKRSPGDRREFLRRLGLFLRERFLAPLIRSKHPPWFDARGVSLGLLVGFGCPVGAQCISLVVLRMVFRFNFVAAFAFSWVTNPFTFVPMYYGYYYLGSVILGRPDILSQEAFTEQLKPLVHADHFWDSLQAFAYLGGDMLLRWLVTGLLFAIPASILGYIVTMRYQRMRCRRKAERLGITYEKLLDDLELRSEKEPKSASG